MMNISEKDLYKYIFYPNKLSKEKFDYISLNKATFKSEIDYLKNIKNSYPSLISNEITNKILDKIEIFEKGNEIILYKIEPDSDNDYLILAADSPREKAEIITSTFKDNNGLFLIKINTTSDRSKIYLFFQDMEKRHEYNLTLNPSGENFEFNSAQLPLIVKPLANIKNINLKFMI